MAAKGNQLKKLFKSFSESDSESFKTVAQSIIDDERRKNHYQLAEELQKSINSTSKTFSYTNTGVNENYLNLLPKDKDSNFSLIDIKNSKLILEDLILEREVNNALIDFIKEFEKNDILAAYGLKARNKILFCGPPGCGKTVTAEAIAGQLSIPLLYTRFDSLVSSYLGETAANLRKVFDFIKTGTWVLFFDEFDAIAKSRDNLDEHGELKRVVNSFLQLLDNYNGNSIIIAATNHQNLLDSAIWRRFDEVVMFNRPTTEHISELISKQLKRYPNEIDVNKYSKDLLGLPHSDIERICLTVVKRAILEGYKTIEPEFFEREIKNYKLRNSIYSEYIK